MCVCVCVCLGVRHGFPSKSWSVCGVVRVHTCPCVSVCGSLGVSASLGARVFAACVKVHGASMALLGPRCGLTEPQPSHSRSVYSEPGWL